MATVQDGENTKEVKEGQGANKPQGQKQQTQQKPAITEVSQEQPKADPLDALSKDEAEQVRLVRSLLGEFTSTITKQSDLGDSARGAFGKLHGAFRTMMDLRGEAHKQAARVFLEFFNSHGKKSLDYDMRCRHLDLLTHDVRPVFTGYLDLLCRFEKAENKGQFRKNNNIDRLVGRIADRELAESVNEVFPG